MTTGTIVLWAFILLLLAGGLMGFLKAGSKASLIASSAFALPLVLVAVRILPSVIADVVLVILLLYMGAKFARTRKMMPSGMMAVASAVTLVIRLLAR